MPYNEQLVNKIRVALANTPGLVEKKMFGGVAFMLNDKMCIGVDKDDIMLRCEPDKGQELLTIKGVRAFNLTGKPMKGWLLVGPECTKNKKDFEWWVQTALDENKKIATAKKKK